MEATSLKEAIHNGIKKALDAANGEFDHVLMVVMIEHEVKKFEASEFGNADFVGAEEEVS